MSPNNRRQFIKLALSSAALAASHSVLLAKRSNNEDKLYPLPPGAVSLARFKSKCTACQLCVNHCPSHVLKPALFENGLSGMMQPVLRFGVKKFCEYECTRCIDVCPNDALVKLSVEEKKLTRIGLVKLIFHECVVKKDFEDCGACAEHCPTAALKMEPWKRGLTRPVIVAPDTCIGCGGCESICPTERAAIYIARYDEHEQATAPSIEKQPEVELDGFGF